MAMPQDFWRNAQSLNIFRTKPCQRLANEGVCSWKSQCQYSHCVDWPRRQPLKYSYSPMLCPNVRQCLLTENQVDKPCPAGLMCPMAHSQEEILLHPDIFKTRLCEEYGGSQRSGKGGKRHACHRYYCPLAHGSQELRSSSLTEEYRNACLQSAELFLSDTCCMTCAPSWNTTRPFKPSLTNPAFCMDPACGIPWPQAGSGSPYASTNFWPTPPDTTDQLPILGWPKDDVEAETTDANGLPYALQGQTLGGIIDPFKTWKGMSPPGLEDSPVFIDVGQDGSMRIGPRSPSHLEAQGVLKNTQATQPRVYSSI